MNRAIPFVLSASSVALAFACGSSGSGGLYAAPSEQATSYQSPFFNALQPGSNLQAPASNPNQPSGDPNTAPTNPDQPPSSGVVPTGGASCENLCAMIAACEGPDPTCLGDCQSTFSVGTACLDEITAAYSCVQSTGFICTESGHVRLAGDQCDNLIIAMVNCLSPDGGNITIVANGTGGGPATLQ